jgi:adenylate cyclase class IV
MEKLDEHTEFEVKFRADGIQLEDFRDIVKNISGFKKAIFVSGPDQYFTKPDGSFARFRKPEYGLMDGGSEITIKKKTEGSKNNIIRKEVNWKLGSTPDNTVVEGLLMMGYKFNFSINKDCHIFVFDDATVVYYTVTDTTDKKRKKPESFIEIEVKEENIKDLTEKEAWSVIEKYEKPLEALGISPQRRMKKSLYEMFVRNTNEQSGS